MENYKVQFLTALREAIRTAGSQTELARKAGMQQGRISDYLTGRYDVDNITLGTLRRLFPDMQIQFTHSNCQVDNIRNELLEIYDSLDAKGQAHLLAMAAANFGDKLREETK